MTKRIWALCAFVLLISQPAFAQVVTPGLSAAFNPLSTSKITHVATNTGIPDQYNTTNKWIEGDELHDAPNGMYGWQVCDVAYYVAAVTAPSNGQEVAVGASASTVEEYIEYPVGSATYYRAKWSGANTGSIPTGGTLCSDPNYEVTIPPGGRFKRWYSFYSPDGQAYANLIGDPNTRANSATTQGVLTPGEVHSINSSWLPPATYLGIVTKDGYNLFGDSTVRGTRDTSDDSLNLGIIGRTIGAYDGYANLAIPGERLTTAKLNYAKRGIIAAYGTVNAGIYGANDIIGSVRTPAQLIGTDLPAFYALTGITGKPTYQATLIPFGVTTTDAYATLANQTIGTQDANRVAFNNLLKAGIPTIKGVLDVAKVLEDVNNPGKYAIINGAQPTNDGNHPLRVGYLAIQSSGVVMIATRFAANDNDPFRLFAQIDRVKVAA